MRRPSPLLLLLLLTPQVLHLSCGLQQHRSFTGSPDPFQPLPSRESGTHSSTSTRHYVLDRAVLGPFVRFLQSTAAPCKAPSFQVQYGGLTFCTRCTEDQALSTSEGGVSFCKAVSCTDKYGPSRPLWNPTLGICQPAPGTPSCLPGFICPGTPPVHWPGGGAGTPIADTPTLEPPPEVPRISSDTPPPPPPAHNPDPGSPVAATDTVSPPSISGEQGAGAGQLSGTPDSPTALPPPRNLPAYSSAPSPPSSAPSPCGAHGSWSVTTGQCVCAHGWAPASSAPASSAPGNTPGSGGSTGGAGGGASGTPTGECSAPQGVLANPPIDSEATTSAPGSAAITPGGQGAAGGGVAGASGGSTSGVPVVWVVLVGLALLSLSCACGAGALCCWRRARRGDAARDKERKSQGEARDEMAWRLAQAHGSFAVIQDGAQGGGAPMPMPGARGVHPVLVGGHPAEAHRWDASSAGTPYWYQMSGAPFPAPAAGLSPGEGAQRGRGFSEPPPVSAPPGPWSQNPAEYYSTGPHQSPTWATGVPTSSFSRGGSHPTMSRPASNSDPPPYRAAPAAGSSVRGPSRHDGRELPAVVFHGRGMRSLEESYEGEGEENLC